MEDAMVRDVEGEQVAAIHAFLRATDHAPDNVEDQYADTLNPDLRPRPDKRYPTLPPIPLTGAAELRPTSVSALTAIADAGASGMSARKTLDLDALARLAYFTNGITKTIHR